MWRVDERLRHELESRFGADFSKVNDQIIEEASRIILGIEKGAEVTKGSETDPDRRRCLNWLTAVHKAEHGKEPSQTDFDKMKDVVSFVFSKKNKEDSHAVVDLSLARLYGKASSAGGKIVPDEIQKELAESRMTIVRALDGSHYASKTVCRNLEMQK